MTRSDATSSAVSGPGSNDNEGLLRIPLNSSTIRLSSVISGHSLEEVLTLCRDWAKLFEDYNLFELRVFVLLNWLPYQRERAKSSIAGRRIVGFILFQKMISAMLNANNLIVNLYTDHQVHFQQR